MNSQKNTQTRGIISSALTLLFLISFGTLVFTSVGCNKDTQQPKSQPTDTVNNEVNLAILPDRTEGSQLTDLIDPTGVLKNMGVNGNLGETDVYGTVFLTPINANSLNEVKEFSLNPPGGFNETRYQRNNVVNNFRSKLEIELNKLNALPAGANNTSIWRPFCDMVNHMSKKSGTKKIILASDMMENFITSFYRYDFSKKDDFDDAVRKLNKEIQCPNITGFEIIIVYKPTSVPDDIRFRAATDLFWRPYLESLGARVSIRGNL